MKKLLLYFSLIVLLVGCTDKNLSSNLDKTSPLDKEFVESNAEIGLSKEEIKDLFGEEYISGNVDNSDVWLYDSVKKDHKYEPSLEAVAFEEIKNETVSSQLYIIFVDDKAIMYSYFYKGSDDKVWQYVLNPDETIIEMAVSK